MSTLVRMLFGWRLAIPLVVVAALVVPGSGVARPAVDSYPLFYIGGTSHGLGERNDLYFDVLELQTAGSPAAITLTSPAGYQVSPAYRPGFYFGEADVYTSKGTYSGEIDSAPKALFNKDPAVAGCAEGAHAATWLMILKGAKGKLTVPVAVDWTAAGIKLTGCLGTFNAAGLKVSEVYFETRSVFRNPSKSGVYRFSAHVVPVGADGSPSPSTQYELRADEPLPQHVTVASAAYDRVSHTLTISGNVHADNKGRIGINVHMFAGQSSEVGNMNEVGASVTVKDGAYSFSKKILIPPAYVLAYVRHYDFARCSFGSNAPGGCASETIDGAPSDPIKVKALTTTP